MLKHSISSTIKKDVIKELEKYKGQWFITDKGNYYIFEKIIYDASNENFFSEFYKKLEKEFFYLPEPFIYAKFYELRYKEENKKALPVYFRLNDAEIYDLEVIENFDKLDQDFEIIKKEGVYINYRIPLNGKIVRIKLL